jgi:hypothetical protein
MNLYHKYQRKNNLIAILIFWNFLLIIGGCNFTSPTSLQAVSNQKNPASGCPDRPSGSLESKDVKPIQLSSQTITETGQAKADHYLGYTFAAKSGQKLSYQSNDDICVWIYAPDNNITTSKDLSQTGKYIIQVAAPKGLRNFELKMGLDVSQPLVASSSTSLQTNVSTVTTTSRQDPEKFVRTHYISLNNRQYSETWSHLSSRFKNESASYSEYQQWWNSVKEIKIGNIRQVKQRGNTAIVDAELWYLKNDGKTYPDSKNRIYLIWSNDSNSWLFDRKSLP